MRGKKRENEKKEEGERKREKNRQIDRKNGSNETARKMKFAKERAHEREGKKGGRGGAEEGEG